MEVASTKGSGAALFDWGALIIAIAGSRLLICGKQRDEKAMALVYGVVFGTVIGVLTGQLAICVALGTSFGVLVQGVLDAKKAKPDA